MTNEEKQQKIRDTHLEAVRALSSRPLDTTRDNWSFGRSLREILDKVRPLGVLDSYELVELEYIAAHIDSIEEERSGVEGMGEI